MVACGSWFHLSDVLIDGFADDVGNRAVLVLGDLFEFSELLRFQPDRRKCFRHDLIVYQRYTMKSWRKHLRDRKSTRLNSSHTVISYAVFCLKKKKKKKKIKITNIVCKIT